MHFGPQPDTIDDAVVTIDGKTSTTVPLCVIDIYGHL
jgi:hypothetical protein